VRAERRPSTFIHLADHDHRKHIDIPILSTAGVTVGCDLVGTVVALGPKVTKDYKVGDRIAGVCHGSNLTQPEDGAFGEYSVVKEGLTFKVPEQMSDEQAATVGVAVTTIASGLYDKLGMPMPGSQKTGEGHWLLVYGGSTAMGSLAIQSAVLCVTDFVRWLAIAGKLTILTDRDTKSSLLAVRVTSTYARHLDMIFSLNADNPSSQFVKSLGAGAAFDYNDSDCSKKVNEHTGDQLSLVFDCIAEGDSTKICTAALSSNGGKIAALLPVSQENSRTNVTHEVCSHPCI